MKAPNYIVEQAAPLVKEHLAHIAFEDHCTKRMVQRLARRVQPASLEDLCQIMQSDQDGRPPLPKGRGKGIRVLRDAARTMGVEKSHQGLTC